MTRFCECNEVRISEERIVKKRDKATVKDTSNRIRFSIKNKILLLVSMSAIPFLILALCILISMSKYNRTYDEIVDNLTVANSYNISFKEEMDESLYKIVVGYTTFETIAEENELKDPYLLITELRNRFTELEKVTIDEESAIWLVSLLRNLDTLEERVDDIVENVEAGGHYEENIKELDNLFILLQFPDSVRGKRSRPCRSRLFRNRGTGSFRCRSPGSGRQKRNCTQGFVICKIQRKKLLARPVFQSTQNIPLCTEQVVCHFFQTKRNRSSGQRT